MKLSNPNLLLKTFKFNFQNLKFRIPISNFRNPTSKDPRFSNPAIQFILDEAQQRQSPKTKDQCREEEVLQDENRERDSGIQIFHPWPEWVDLMEKLLKSGYFEGIGNPFENNGVLGNKEANLIRTACLNYARDRYELIRYLSREDILAVASCGCPSTDRKVVNSGKRLRAHLGIDEGNVCSTCTLRGNCERAYVKAREEEGGRTVDVMRFLLTYGLDPATGSVENKPCLNKRVKESVRKLLKEVTDFRVEEDYSQPLSASNSGQNSSVQENHIHEDESEISVPKKQGDWICPKCNFLNFSRNIRCLRCNTLSQERLKKLAEDQEHLPLKKGDWICDKCNFMNFAKNTRCLLCKENPPKRELNPGEWQCESCNYINFRRNMVCLKCDHHRPKALNTAVISSEPTTTNIANHRMWRHDKQSRDGDHRSWNFVASDAKDHNSSNSRNEVSAFDFPILGGKSELSNDVQKQERWRLDMANKSKRDYRRKEDADEFKSSRIRGRREFLESTSDDDDEMADWFGPGKDSNQ